MKSMLHFHKLTGLWVHSFSDKTKRLVGENISQPLIILIRLCIMHTDLYLCFANIIQFWSVSVPAVNCLHIFWQRWLNPEYNSEAWVESKIVIYFTYFAIYSFPINSLLSFHVKFDKWLLFISVHTFICQQAHWSKWKNIHWSQYTICSVICQLDHFSSAFKTIHWGLGRIQSKLYNKLMMAQRIW